MDALPGFRIVSTEALGPFSWRWPEDVEHFERGWLALVNLNGAELQVRHGIGRRNVFGASRPHSVTWVNNEPTVEGVGADDYDQSGALLSLIKVTKKQLRPHEPVPEGYSQFHVVVMAEAVSGPYSPRSRAVKIREDDVDAWAHHAILRAWAWGRLTQAAVRRERSALPSQSASGPAPAVGVDGATRDRQAAVVEALLAYAASKPKPEPGVAVNFTPLPEANEFVRDNAFAFLCGVIFDQGVPAERAWRAPYELLQRLGHLAPEKMANALPALATAISTEPKLHRYVEKMPRWIAAAAGRVMTHYGGDARRIWSDEPSADELQRRFDAFSGIGQKKAAMAVEILERDMGIPIRALERSDIAYDVHIRRVFLRARLADRDDRDHMIARARELYPQRPGALDMPAWLIGRKWCHPGAPTCERCPLTMVCPKDIERAAHVTSG